MIPKHLYVFANGDFEPVGLNPKIRFAGRDAEIHSDGGGDDEERGVVLLAGRSNHIGTGICFFFSLQVFPLPQNLDWFWGLCFGIRAQSSGFKD